MRTTLDLPDDVLRRAKIIAVERGSSLRQLVTDALLHEIEGRKPNTRRRMTSAPIKLAADAPLRSLSPEAVKRIDAESVEKADSNRMHAADR